MSLNPNCRFCKALDAIPDNEFVAESGPNGLTIGGNLVPDDYLTVLAGETKLFQSMSLKSVFTETARAHAINLGMKKATDYDQVLFGKALLYVTDLIESSMRAIQQEDEKRKKAAELKKANPMP